MSERLVDLDLYELLSGLEKHEFSHEQLMDETLGRIADVNPTVNAIVSLRDRDELLAEAKAFDMKPRVGKLDGIPIAIKDLVETKDLRTTHGSPIFANHMPQEDELIVSRIRGAGAILIGKTNVPEFGLGSNSYNPVFGRTRNPYDLTKTAGGSSGGAGAALAARMVPIADGSDMMGSLRNPAAFCNVYGLRPTYGLVPGDPKGDVFLHQLSTLGPMARSVTDLAILLDVIAGPDPRLPHSILEKPRFEEAAKIQPKPKRIGWLGSWANYFPIEPEILSLCERALGVFSGLGHTVEDIELEFDPSSLWTSWTRLRSLAIAGSLGDHYDSADENHLLKPEAIFEIEAGRQLSPVEILEASRIRSDWFCYTAQAFEKWDAIVLPSAQVFPFDAEVNWPNKILNQDLTTYHKWMEVVVPASLIGLPAINVPVGFSTTGLPMGMQIIGKRSADAELLSLGNAYHVETRWPQIKSSSID
ncbi:MAG: amidase [Pseudomonadota bacterium]